MQERERLSGVHVVRPPTRRAGAGIDTVDGLDPVPPYLRSHLPTGPLSSTPLGRWSIGVPDGQLRNSSLGVRLFGRPGAYFGIKIFSG